MGCRGDRGPATHARILSPPALLGRLNRQLELLTGVPARRASAVANPSPGHRLELRPPGSRPSSSLFRRLAVFAGGFTVEMAEAVCGDFGLPILDFGLEQPLEVGTASPPTIPIQNPKSKIQNGRAGWPHFAGRQEPAGAGRVGDAEPRFVMLSVVREYASERRRPAEKRTRLGRAHARVVSALVEQAERELSGPDQTAWLARLDADHENLRAALAWAFEHGASELGLRLAGGLWRFWMTRGYLTEGQQWLDRVLSTGGAAPPVVGSQSLERGRQPGAHAWRVAARGCTHEASLDLRRELRDVRGVVVSLTNLGQRRARPGRLQRCRLLLPKRA